MESNNILIKGLIVAGMVLAMLIPIQLVKSLISEREETKDTVENEISSKWGGQQHVKGPVLVLPYLQKKLLVNGQTTKDKEEVYVTKYAYFLPDDLLITGDISTEERARTLYQALVYQSKMEISGSFSNPDYEKLHIKNENIKWDEAFLMIGVSNLQGIKNKITVNMDGKELAVQPGVPKNEIIKTGITIKMPIDADNMKEKYSFDLKLLLNGTDNLTFSPIGKETKVDLKSDWGTVSFMGDFLPSKRDLDNGFSAQWDIFDYNRNYAQAWIGENSELDNSQLGVELRLPINQYQKNMRAIKYAIMFIALTFVAFFLVELLSKKRIHPMQYILVSFALILFYTLLLSLSEHLGFGLAYLISSAAIILLVSSYSISIFKSNKQAVMMGIFLIVLYTYLYVVLQLEDMALLFGSIGLFIALATVMFVSRKVNWYNLGINNNKPKTNSQPIAPPPYIGDSEVL